MDLKWLVVYMGRLDLIGMWFWGGSKSKHCKDTCFKEIGLSLGVLIISLHSIVNTTIKIYVSIQE